MRTSTKIRCIATPCWLIAMAIGSLGCSHREPSVVPASIAGGSVGPRESRLTFVAPDGFAWNEQHRVWHNKGARTTVSISHSPGVAFQSVVDDFTPERMRNAGMETTLQEVRDVGGRRTLLVRGRRLKAPYPQEYCTVAYGASAGSAQLTAIYPAASSDRFKGEIERALLESQFEQP